MDPFRVLQDWGLGALVFLGLAAQPATFNTPLLQRGAIVFSLQDAFPDELQTLIDYGTEVTIHYHIRFHTRAGVRDTAVEQSLVYDRRRQITRLSRGGESGPSLPKATAQRWVSTLEVPLGTIPPEQISVRAVLRLQGRSEAESAGLWGGVPAATWQRESR